jgi:IclR family transcriptional regulator, KDG regulon repressor
VLVSELKHGSSTVVFALQVLEFIAQKGEVGLTEIAKSLNANKSRVVRVLRSLSLYGYVTQNETSRKYRLGTRVATLAGSYHRNGSLESLAQPHLKRLRDLFGGTAILRVMERDTVVTVASEETSSDLKVTHRVGSSFHLARGAHGKVLAAYMPERTVRFILRSQGIIKYTPKTIVGIENFMRHLKQVRLQGFGFDDEEVEKGVRSLAAPVQESGGKVIASIGVSAPSFLIPKSSVSSVARSVKQIAVELSAELGWSIKRTSANKVPEIGA